MTDHNTRNARHGAAGDRQSAPEVFSDSTGPTDAEKPSGGHTAPRVATDERRERYAAAMLELPACSDEHAFADAAMAVADAEIARVEVRRQEATHALETSLRDNARLRAALERNANRADVAEAEAARLRHELDARS